MNSLRFSGDDPCGQLPSSFPGLSLGAESFLVGLALLCAAMVLQALVFGRALDLLLVASGTSSAGGWVGEGGGVRISVNLTFDTRLGCLAARKQTWKQRQDTKSSDHRRPLSLSEVVIERYQSKRNARAVY